MFRAGVTYSGASGGWKTAGAVAATTGGAGIRRLGASVDREPRGKLTFRARRKIRESEKNERSSERRGGGSSEKKIATRCHQRDYSATVQVDSRSPGPEGIIVDGGLLLLS